MRPSRIPFYFFVGVLFAVGVALSLYRHIVFDVSWLPGEKKQIWSIEAKISFIASGEAVKVSFAIPDTQEGFQKVAEHTASAGYGLSYIEQEDGRRAEWSIRSASNRQTLYYRTDMLVRKDLGQKGAYSLPSGAPKIEATGPYATSARLLLTQALKRSADAYTLTKELIHEFNSQTQSAEFLMQQRTRSAWIVALLAEAQVKAREVLVLRLEDGRRRQELLTYLQVFEGDQYRLFDAQLGAINDSGERLLWEYHSLPLIDVVGGSQTSVNFSIIEQEVPLNVSLSQGFLAESSLLDFSIHSLPLEEQALFKGILLIPVGVLIVVFFRVFVGIRTSGTFMPVLIAISFIQTTLVTGLIGFVLIVSIGLMIRSYLSRLNLLLVARISAVIISVIVLIAAFTVLAYQLGLSEGLKITFFPMVILAWTIERMSILWEEEGPKEVLAQTGGSLLVALITYMFMTNDVVRHLTFNFLGLQLIFMALVLAMGNYTGYRMLELHRFRPLASR